MTQKLFWKNPYLTECNTTIASVQNNIITVSETIFYAFSGGQESDAGTIGHQPVLKAEKNEHQIYYTLPEEHGLKPHDCVRMSIDWPRRYQLMRLHFAAELILELIYQTFPTTPKIGAHISASKARIDFQFAESIAPFLPNIQHQAQHIIDSAHPIQSKFSDVSSEQRYWKIDGFAQVPCGGTHLKNTQEVQNVTLKRVNIGKNKERIEVYVEKLPIEEIQKLAMQE